MTGLVLILPAVMALIGVYGFVVIVIDALRGGLTAHEERAADDAQVWESYPPAEVPR